MSGTWTCVVTWTGRVTGQAQRRPAGGDGEDDDGEDLFGDNWEKDYHKNPELDRFSAKGLDDSEYSELSVGERMDAELKMRERDKLEGRKAGPGLRRGLETFDTSSGE